MSSHTSAWTCGSPCVTPGVQMLQAPFRHHGTQLGCAVHTAARMNLKGIALSARSQTRRPPTLRWGLRRPPDVVPASATYLGWGICRRDQLTQVAEVGLFKGGDLVKGEKTQGRQLRDPSPAPDCWPPPAPRREPGTDRD